MASVNKAGSNSPVARLTILSLRTVFNCWQGSLSASEGNENEHPDSTSALAITALILTKYILTPVGFVKSLQTKSPDVGFPCNVLSKV
jgi:hypothetical protein